MKSLLLIIAVVLSLFSSPLHAQQIKSFSSNPEKYLKELSSFMQETNESNKKKEAKDLMEKYSTLWLEGSLSDPQKNAMFNLSNELLSKKALPFPHFRDFIATMIAFAAKSNQDNFNNYEKGLLTLTKNKKISIRVIEKYLNIMSDLIVRNSLYKSPTTEWRASNENYRIIADDSVRVVFGEINLTCFAKGDSINIYKTQGILYPMQMKWKGANGKVTWQRAGYKEEEVFAQLRRYEIDITKSKYKADSVLFVNTIYYPNPITGKLEDDVKAIQEKERESYPRFESYINRFEIKNIFPGVDYNGGFSMHGAKFIGSGSKEELAFMNFYQNDTLKLSAFSKNFFFSEKQIVAPDTKIIFHVDTDSIYHPGLLFKFFKNTREVLLVRDEKGMARSPYFNSYHDIDMVFEEFSWKIDDPRVEFRMMKGTSIRSVLFESSDYFKIERYKQIQGMDDVNPIYTIYKLSKEYGITEFNVKDLANYMRISMDQVRQTVMRLAFLGFISFDFETEEIKINDKLFRYLRNLNGKQDYDVIQFSSETKEAVNASLNLLNNNINMSGVSEISLSDSQNVFIYPKDQKILLKRNRDFEFDGKIDAGLFTYFGKNFSFEYNNFKINLVDVDSMKIKVITNQVDMYGNPALIEVRSVIEDVKGDILIDNPFNKSGVKKFPEYPIFNSVTNSYVYYDKRSIMGSTYPRDKFYFQVYPYQIDSLDNFSSKYMAFNGYFESAGIFPGFEEKLTLQPDYSLGFKRKTPPEGYPVYGGKGTFFNDIMLSNKGLRGDGELKYITSTTYSNDFIFYPDSMHTKAQSFVINKQGEDEGVPYPDVTGDESFVRWLPYQDVMYTSKIEKPITMYEEQAFLHGTLKLQPIGLSGWGKMEFGDAELTSNLFKYGSNTFDADTANFDLKSMDKKEFTFKTHNVNSHIDFVERKGTFKSNGEASFVEFPQNQYICFMDQFDWYMDKEEIEMSASQQAIKISKPTDQLSPTEMEDIQLKGSKFISIHPNQDSLMFVAPSAKYNLLKKTISAKDVKYIRVADGTIYPGDGLVVVERKAQMQTLKNAKIITNNITRYHTIYDAIVNVFGKYSFSGSGYYDYVDETQQSQKIHFNVVSVDSTRQTYATGKIIEPMNFTLSPNFSYQGFVRLEANKEFLIFNGSTKIKHECNAIASNWFNFTSEINPKQIYIPITKDLFSINNDMLAAGIMINKDSLTIYPAFLSKIKNTQDQPLVPVEGFLFFDNNDKKFKISNKDKLVEFNMPGNYLHLHRTFCNMYSEGIIGLGANLGRIEILSVGNISHNPEKNEVLLDLVLAIDFFFADKCIDIMADAINKNTSLEAIDMSRKTYTKALTEIMGREEADKLISEINLYGAFRRMPKEMIHTITFTDLKLSWNNTKHTYTSVGKIGIGNISKTQLNKYVEGRIEIEKKRSGDLLNIYLEIDQKNWFFFSYARNVMQGLSSSEDFNNTIKETKADKRKMEADKGQSQYSYFLAPETKMKKFRAGIDTGESEDKEKE